MGNSLGAEDLDLSGVNERNIQAQVVLRPKSLIMAFQKMGDGNSLVSQGEKQMD